MNRLFVAWVVSAGLLLAVNVNAASPAQQSREPAIRQLLNIGDGDLETTPFTINPEHLRMGDYISQLAGFEKQFKECLRLVHLQGRSSVSLVACNAFDEFNRFIDRYGVEGLTGESDDLTPEQNLVARELGARTVVVIQAIQSLLGM